MTRFNFSVFQRIIICLFMFTAASSSSAFQGGDDFITCKGIHFHKGVNPEPYYFVGTNLWYGPILGSTCEGGNRERLCQELDTLQQLGVNNLRILVGADAGTVNSPSVEPFLQIAPGQYEEALLEGLDFMLVEMHKREMYAVIYLTNSWDWSGGFGFYLKATGHGDSPDAHGEGWSDYVDYARCFFHDTQARQLYLDHVRHVVSRVNTVTGKPYRDDSTIMSWQLCNEPRPFGKTEESAFVDWIRESASVIKSIDTHHLVSTGSEGVVGCNVSYDLCREVHALSDIDYLTVHIWPANWRWANTDSLYESLPAVFEKSNAYIALHDSLSTVLRKPYVIEEFGYPRDGNLHVPGSSTKARDSFYRFIFDHVKRSAEGNGPLAGCNFWGWGGIGRPQAEQWEMGADYLCDPPHEPQGWYSVFNNDTTTVRIISDLSL